MTRAEHRSAHAVFTETKQCGCQTASMQRLAYGVPPAAEPPTEPLPPGAIRPLEVPPLDFLLEEVLEEPELPLWLIPPPSPLPLLLEPPLRPPAVLPLLPPRLRLWLLPPLFTEPPLPPPLTPALPPPDPPSVLPDGEVTLPLPPAEPPALPPIWAKAAHGIDIAPANAAAVKIAAKRFILSFSLMVEICAGHGNPRRGAEMEISIMTPLWAPNRLPDIISRRTERSFRSYRSGRTGVDLDSIMIVSS